MSSVGEFLCRNGSETSLRIDMNTMLVSGGAIRIAETLLGTAAPPGRMTTTTDGLVPTTTITQTVQREINMTETAIATERLHDVAVEVRNEANGAFEGAGVAPCRRRHRTRPAHLQGRRPPTLPPRRPRTPVLALGAQEDGAEIITIDHVAMNDGLHHETVDGHPHDAMRHNYLP